MERHKMDPATPEKYDCENARGGSFSNPTNESSFKWGRIIILDSERGIPSVVFRM